MLDSNAEKLVTSEGIGRMQRSPDFEQTAAIAQPVDDRVDTKFHPHY